MFDFEFTIDFESQKFVDRFIKYSLYLAAFISFLIGFVLQDILYTIYSYVSFIVIVGIITLPSYPFYNKNRVKFLEVKYEL